jgi:hypothetical protein
MSLVRLTTAETVSKLKANFKSGTRTIKNAENISRHPNYFLIISPKWEIIYPIGKIPGFSHSLCMQLTALRAAPDGETVRQHYVGIFHIQILLGGRYGRAIIQYCS